MKRPTTRVRGASEMVGEVAKNEGWRVEKREEREDAGPVWEKKGGRKASIFCSEVGKRKGGCRGEPCGEHGL